MNNEALKPLGRVMEIIQVAGMSISYAFEDLVFLEHNGFLLRFGDDPDKVFVHLNSEADEEELSGDLAVLRKVAERHGMVFREDCRYQLSPVEEENIRIEFLEQ